MKTTILIDESLDEPARFAEAKLPTLAIRMLAEAYSKHRRSGGALLLIDKGVDSQPVYLTVGSHPPELHVGDRTLWGVCVPTESQDPVAIFMDRAAAVAWGDAQGEPYRLAEVGVDSGDAPRVAVAVICNRDGKTLLGKLTSGIWTLPEGLLSFGETIDGAAQRVLLRTVGLRATGVALSRTAPFVNTYYADLRRHFITIVALAMTSDEPRVVDPAWVEWAWFDTQLAPPTPLLPTVQQIMTVAAAAGGVDAVTSAVAPTPATAESPPSPSKRLRPRRSKSP